MKETFLTGGDWPVFFKDTISSFSWIPQVWSSVNGNGFGQNVAFVLGYKTFFTILAKFFTETLGFSWYITEKVIFFIPFWILALSSSYLLSHYFIRKKKYSILSSIIFTTNTYALMLVGGGQMGVAIAYAISPLVLLSLLRLMDNQVFRRFILASLLFGFLLMIDPRIAGVTLFIASIFLIFFIHIKNTLYLLGSIFLSVLMNCFWILPFLFSGISGLTEAYIGTDILYFLSFAKLENTIGLLHPNWPENFFGKVGFMRPEFLILPTIAFSAFLSKTEKKTKILGITAIFGIFLSKGVNDPFGFFYYILSDHIPAFTMFRDSTKWYLMIVISYSVLVPLALYSFTEKLLKLKKLIIYKLQFTNKLKNFRYLHQVVIVSFLIFWIITVRQLFLGELTGTFQAKEIPHEYVRLEKLLASEANFSRVLWVPQQSRFGYFSNTHPPVAMYDLITSHDVKPAIKYLASEKNEDFIKKSSIKYVIVPYDSLGEIFLTDRKFDEKVYKAFLNELKQIPYLNQDVSFKKIGVFKVNDYYPHAYFEKSGEKIFLERKSGTRYVGEILPSEKRSKIIFSETYDSSWRLKASMQDIQSQKHMSTFNSFEILSGTTRFEIVHETQFWVQIGLFVSFSTIGVLVLLMVLKREK